MSPTVYRQTTPPARTTVRVHPERSVPEEAPSRWRASRTSFP
jgi:hypothetical protein